MSKNVIIVQARMTSTRLPGKVLMQVCGETILSHVLRRCAKITDINTVCCAVPEGNVHQPVADEAIKCGAVVFRGSEDDVLDRYAGAAAATQANVVMRVTSDCPLIDQDVCASVLKLVTHGGVEYACNNMPASWPHGLDCEAFTASALHDANIKAKDPYEREHVTPWLRNNPNLRRANLIGPGGWDAEQRLTLDYQEDFILIEKILSELSSYNGLPSTLDVMRLLRQKSELQQINRKHHNISRPKP